MKIPLNWLREYVDFDLTAPQLVERLTFAGLEVSGIRVLGLPIPEGLRVKAEDRGPVWDRDKIVVAQIVSVDRHPDADRLKLPTLTWGEGKVKQIVTGAPNVNVGDSGGKVVLGLTGSKLFDGHSEERVIKELKPTKIRGVPSDSMVCSMQELGINFDKKLNEGIIYLDDDVPIGTPLADVMGDIVLEIDVLPNMARALAMTGVAREVAALTGKKLKLPPTEVKADGPAIEGKVAVKIENPKLSARYAAMLIQNVQHKPSPGWLQRRLLYAGMAPIDAIVDVTNYVMLEWGQPLHAFDYDVLVQRAGGKAPTITVRSAKAGETLVTLDKQERKLTPENLVIADEKGPIALAGVMGGLETEVTPTTKNVLLESASFDAVSIRKTFMQFDLPSEASRRFSRGIHPETVLPAARRAAELIRQLAGGTVCKGEVDTYPAKQPPQVIELKLSQVNRVLGFEFPKSDAIRILRTLEFDVQEQDADTLKVTAPTHRLDIQAGPADLIEDLARIYGYDRIPETMLSDRLPRQQNNVPIAFEEKVRDLLVGCGVQEAVCYALTTPEKETPFLGAGRKYVEIKNPISSDRTVMRQSVLASVLEVAIENLKTSEDVRLFEVGFVYRPKDGSLLPEEPRRLAIVLSGRRQSEFWTDSKAAAADGQKVDFFDLKGIVQSLVSDLHLAKATYRKSEVGWMHPGRSATLVVDGKAIGDFGELHPRLADAWKLGNRTLLVGEFDLEALQASAPPRFAYTPVSTFPAALRDVAIVVDEAVPAEKAEAEIKAAGGDLLRGVRLFDLYRGDSIPAGKKSLAYALTYQAVDKTLGEKEIDKAHKKIEDRLKHVLMATIRGKE